ncbi:hypothetical protein [Terrimonas sp.]|uniref:hypothetical protein n=1 Tax=Terrimonas sp. TaxID=1914338 RepID=UPI00105726CA|nr:hypothetical protein [Terrimonas sp.]
MEYLQSNRYWSPLKKISFRFIFIFFILFMVIQNNGTFPFWEIVMHYPAELLQKLIPWIGKHVLHLSYDITEFTNGSGDTTYDYVVVFTIACSAFAGTVIWSLLDRKRKSYQTLYYWLTTAVRYYVALMLFNYGLWKVIKMQFPAPDLYRLTQPYGDSSPMGLAWTFLGFSKGYNLFMGFAEIAALLLLFRRTMTLGAVITLCTTANVMAVNYFYDVPVKIVSSMLFIMTLFLLSNDATRLLRFFLTDNPVSLPPIKAPVFSKKWMHIAKASLKTLLIGYTIIFGIYEAKQMEKKYGDTAPKPKLYGLYNVDTFVINNDTLPPLITDTIRWKEFLIEWEGFARLQDMTDRTSMFTIIQDTISKKIDFIPKADTALKYTLYYDTPGSNKLNFKGMIQKDSVSIFMTRKDTKDFLLMNRGFNWINEYPFNR